MAKKKALGKGLSALLSDAEIASPAHLKILEPVVGINEILIAKITPNAHQPRTHFDDDALQDLASSIKQHGLVQPITLRKVSHDAYQIISGERRWRASKIAGLTTLPAYIREIDDEQVLELALIENIQREDLDPMEIAISYQRMCNELKITQDELAQKVNKNRSTVTNSLRLLNLPAPIQLAVREGQISTGHARALLSVKSDDSQLQIFNKILQQGLNVRQVEQLVKADKAEKPKVDTPADALKKAELTFEQQSNYLELQRITRSKIDIKKNGDGKGKIIIDFKNNVDLTRVLDLLMP